MIALSLFHLKLRCRTTLAWAAFAMVFGSAQALANAQITIDAQATGPQINKNIYGQFAEHLGRGIYEGLWVGEDSAIANTRGWRNDVVGALKEIQVPLVRWPGGCFADEYHWRDGIGPRAQRPIRVNTNWGGVEEDNAVGTHEFFDLAEQLGAEVYINGNLGTGTPQEMAEWLEYLTGEGRSAPAQERRANGREAPYRVHYFAVGNEAWGCGGHMTPEYYTNLYRHYSTFLKTPGAHNAPKLIASGGTDENTDWTKTLIASAAAEPNVKMHGISFHYYTLPTGDWGKKGAATQFPESEWMSAFINTLKIDHFIASNTKVMDKYDPEKKVGLYVDEWGTWYDVTEGDNPGFLYQQNSLRDALIAAVNFHIFHKHADRIHMSNIAQMVNVLQAMVLTDKEKMLLTPTYYAYQLYVPFQDATRLPVVLKKVPQYRFGKDKIAALDVSAARAQDGKLYVALINLDPHQSQVVDVAVTGKQAQRAQGKLLTAEKMDAHNTFSAPHSITPVNYSREAVNGKLSLTLPAKSLMVVALE